MLRIGELAVKAGISKRTLYHYEQLELLKPSFIDRNGYRYYKENAIIQLQKILLLKSIGYTLEKIKKLLHNESSLLENETWIQSMNEQLQLIEKEKEELNRKQFYLRTTIQTIQLKGHIEVNEIFQVIQNLEKRQLVDGIILPVFSDSPLTVKEKERLEGLPKFGTNDMRLDGVIEIFQEIRKVMHRPPESAEAQLIAKKLFNKSLELFDGDVQLIDKYWEQIRPNEEEGPKVIGIDGDIMDYIDRMFDYLLKVGEEEN